MIKQFRIGIDEHTFEFPGGVLDPKDPDPTAAALRELTEETGYAPLPGARCKVTGFTHSNPAILNNKTHSLIVGPVSKQKAQNLDPGEMIETFEVSPAQLIELVASGQVTHSLILNTLFFALLGAQGGKDSMTGLLEGISKAL